MDPVRYAKKDIYAEVEEEGGPINRLVAVEGQPVPAAYLDVVDEKDTTDQVPGQVEYPASRNTAARRANATTVAEAEERNAEAAKAAEKRAEGDKPTRGTRNKPRQPADGEK